MRGGQAAALKHVARQAGVVQYFCTIRTEALEHHDPFLIEGESGGGFHRFLSSMNEVKPKTTDTL